MNTLSMINALAGGLLGAIIWAGICVGTGYEHSLVAWGVGILVGVGSRIGGKPSESKGAVCAVIAIFAMLGGKMLTIHYSVPGEIREMLEEGLTQERYNDTVAEAKAFANLKTEKEYPAYLIRYEYTDAKVESEVPQEDIDYFVTDVIPELNKINNDELPYTQWKEEKIKHVTEVSMANVSYMGLIIDNLDIYDFLFAVLGLASAFKIGAGKEKED